MNEIIVYLLITNKSHKRLLKQLLEELGYIVNISSTVTSEAWLSSSIVILDERSVRRHNDEIVRIKRETNPSFVPTVILLSQKHHELIYHQLDFDAVVRLPTLKNESFAQLIMLLRLRTQFDIKYRLAETTLETTEKRIRYMANHDALTDLFNRSQLDLALDLELVKAACDRKQLALIYIDIDRFRSINDAFGHIIGDKVLFEVANRLKQATNPTDLIARVGGDEFIIILMAKQLCHDDILSVVTKIRFMLTEPLVVDQHILLLTTSIGISVYPEDGKSAEDLVNNADTARFAAKKTGKNKFQFCTSALSKRAQDKIIVENQLYSALSDNEFYIQYQPKVNVKSGEITGVEALLRWHNAKLGDILPNNFIPLAEETGLITPITERVFTLVCQHIKSWKKENRQPLDIAINLSGRSFADPEFMNIMTTILKKHTVEPRLITMEITESVLIQEIESNANILKQGTNLGLKMSIDDFGTGYSSLNYLKYFAIDSLKIDQSFVRDITTDPNDALIVSAIIAMAHSLKFKVIAEGVETKEQYDFLKKQGCDEVQGFYFCKPLSPEDLLTFIALQK